MDIKLAGTAKITTDVKFEDVVSILPETRALETAVDAFFHRIHDDAKIDQAALFFGQIRSQNRALLSDLQPQQEALILFHHYITIASTKFKQCDSYTAAYKKFAALPANKSPQPLANKVVATRIRQMFHGFPSFALAKALEVEVKTLQLGAEPDDAMVAIADQVNSSTLQFFD